MSETIRVGGIPVPVRIVSMWDEQGRLPDEFFGSAAPGLKHERLAEWLLAWLERKGMSRRDLAPIHAVLGVLYGYPVCCAIQYAWDFARGVEKIGFNRFVKAGHGGWTEWYAKVGLGCGYVPCSRHAVRGFHERPSGYWDWT